MTRESGWGRLVRAAALSLTGALALLAGGAAWASPPASAAASAAPWYLALGASASVGVQPTAADPSGQPTDDGYANDLLVREQSRWPGLRLAKLGCPGETTTDLVTGGGPCRYRSGSQLLAATHFLYRHRSTVLVTLDIGFNNVVSCLADEQVNQACVEAGLDAAAEQVPEILASLRRADRHLDLVGVSHYDPYLGYWLDGPSGEAFAAAGASVLGRLNATLDRAYGRAHVPVANVVGAFDSHVVTLTELAGRGQIPTDVAEACQLTWMCSAAPYGPNLHPNAAGYEAIATAIRAALPAQGS